MNLPRLSKTYDLYIFGVGSLLLTSPQDLASKRAPDPHFLEKVRLNHINITKKSYNMVKKPHWEIYVHAPLLSGLMVI
jgi:hypothetical protein